MFSFMITCCFVLVRVTMDPEPIPETLGVRDARALRTHTFTHLFTPWGNLA